MRILLGNKILLPDAPEEFVNTLSHKLTLLNPKWLENEKQGRWNKGVPKNLEFFKKTKDGFEIPRGYMRKLINASNYSNIDFCIEDKRRSLPEVDFLFQGKLKAYQQAACDAVIKKHFGVLTAPTGSGKTVMMLYIIAMRKQPALIVVHTKDLAFQWIERIHHFLGIPEEEIGFIGAGKNKIGEKITVAMVQSLYKNSKKTAPSIGHLIIDECHRTPSRTFTEAIAPFDSFYMTGLSATPFRRDRLSKLIFWYLGDTVYEVDKTALVHNGDILQAEIIFRTTDFFSETDPTTYYTKLMSELTTDNHRNSLIADDIAKEAGTTNGVCLVLSDRKAHCEIIRSILKNDHNIDADVLTGDLKIAERKEILNRLEQNQIKVLIATSQLIGEGFDSDTLSTLFLIYPIRFSGRLLQYLGRILRPGTGKKNARVFDYVDIKIGVLEAAGRARMAVYNSSPSR